MGGELCYAGTRVPVRIVDQLEREEGIDVAAEAYPSINREHLERGLRLYRRRLRDRGSEGEGEKPVCPECGSGKVSVSPDGSTRVCWECGVKVREYRVRVCSISDTRFEHPADEYCDICRPDPVDEQDASRPSSEGTSGEADREVLNALSFADDTLGVVLRVGLDDDSADGRVRESRRAVRRALSRLRRTPAPSGEEGTSE